MQTLVTRASLSLASSRPMTNVPPVAQQGRHFTRSQTRLYYKAAGVLPFAFLHGVPVVLLGAEAVKTGPKGKITKTMWRDFGGQREAIDEDSESTASREFAEETMGLFGGCDVNGSCVAACSEQMHAQLSSGQHVLKVVHQLKKGEYHMYIAQTPHIDPLMFHLALQQNDETDAVCGAEKTAFAWVALSDLLGATVPCAKRYFLHAYAHTTGNRRQPVFHGLRRMQLHPCFASSLRLAENAGLMEVIAAARAATMLHPQVPVVLPAPVLAQPPCTADLRQVNCTLRAHQPQPNSAVDVHGSGTITVLCDEHMADSCQSMIAQEPVLAKPVSPTVVPGLTPEHMLYWVSQAGIAQQLQCPPGIDEAAASSSFPAAEHESRCCSQKDKAGIRGPVAKLVRKRQKQQIRTAKSRSAKRVHIAKVDGRLPSC